MSKLFSTVKLSAGFGNRGQDEYATAKRPNWRWRFDEQPPERFTAVEIDEEQQAFRDQM